jgi:hypothetical protein
MPLPLFGKDVEPGTFDFTSLHEMVAGSTHDMSVSRAGDQVHPPVLNRQPFGKRDCLPLALTSPPAVLGFSRIAVSETERPHQLDNPV